MLNVVEYSGRFWCVFAAVGIAHRDLKPENILCEKHEKVSILTCACRVSKGTQANAIFRVNACHKDLLSRVIFYHLIAVYLK